LAEALELTLLLAEGEPEKYERTAKPLHPSKRLSSISHPEWKGCVAGPPCRPPASTVQVGAGFCCGADPPPELAAVVSSGSGGD